MSSVILFWSFFIAQLFLAIAMAISVYRIAIGPRAQDRVLGVIRFTSTPCCWSSSSGFALATMSISQPLC